MKFKWTIKQLNEFTNKRIIIALINERKSELNPYAPLAVRLTELARWVENNIKE